MKKLIVLFTFLCISCAKETKEDDPQVAHLKKSLVGTTWTYYYKYTDGDIDVSTYTFKDYNSGVIDHVYGNNSRSHVFSYKYEYPNLYVSDEYNRFTEYRMKNPYKVDAYKKEIIFSIAKLPLRQGNKDSMQPYSFEDLVKVPIKTDEAFRKEITEWVSERSKERMLFFQMNTGEWGVFSKGWNLLIPYKKGNDYFIVSYNKLEYPNIYLKLEYLKEVPKDTTLFYNADNKWFIEDRDREPIYDKAIFKNNDIDIEFNGETFHRIDSKY
ncbi:hypothetical protein [Capnocytophaga granulosa]